MLQGFECGMKTETLQSADFPLDSKALVLNRYKLERTNTNTHHNPTQRVTGLQKVQLGSAGEFVGTSGENSNTRQKKTRAEKNLVPTLKNKPPFLRTSPSARMISCLHMHPAPNPKRFPQPPNLFL